MFSFFLPFSLNNTLFLDTYKPSVIVFKCSLSFVVYKPMINIIVCKKKVLVYLRIRMLIKVKLIKKVILYLWEKDEIAFRIFHNY